MCIRMHENVICYHDEYRWCTRAAQKRDDAAARGCASALAPPAHFRPARPLKLGGIQMLPCAHVQHLIQGRRRFVQPLCETVLFHDGGQR